MKVVMATSELTPFAKTGGLADMVGMLSGELCHQGATITIIMPLYGHIQIKKHKLENLKKNFFIDMAGRKTVASLWKGYLPGVCENKCEIYFIQNDEYYNRPFLYGNSEGDYADNCERFVFFSKAVLETIKEIDLNPDVIHCHDWQTALIPVYLSTFYSDDENLKDVNTLLTIHNLAYQGVFWHWDWPLTSLDWSLFSWQGLEFYGKMNLLKGGIVFADAISTVSKTYSQEIQTPEYGCGLDGVFRARKANVHGIINGLDYQLWNPETDKCITENYSIRAMSGKRSCKLALQKELGLEVDAGIPLVAMVGRVVEQKGIDLLEECFDAIMDNVLQLVILGTGNRHHTEKLRKMMEKYGSSAHFAEGFNDRLARRIYSGSDILLMPSLFEPCGLSQLIAMKYGSVPIVHSTGGLADTVVDFSPEGLEDGSATGFVFLEKTPAALCDEVIRAITHFEDADDWFKLMCNCMSKDWSFCESAQKYLNLYKSLGKTT